MKPALLLHAGCTGLLATLLSAAPLQAQAQTTETSTVRETAPAGAAAEAAQATTLSGTVSAWEPEILVINAGEGLKPVRYSWSKTTRYQDEAGRTVTRESIRAGSPVTVYYSRDGNRAVADRVVIRRATAAAAAPGAVPVPGAVTRTTEESTTRTALPEAPPLTVTKGEIFRMDQNTLMIRTKNAEEPIKYTRTAATTYQDETATAVQADRLKTGMPVTVYYTEDRNDDGSFLRADRVVINENLPPRPAGADAPPPASASAAGSVLSGAVSAITVDSVSIRPQPGALPVTYTWTTAPAFVDEKGAVLDLALLSPGTPVTVQFTKNADAGAAAATPTVNRITVKRADLIPAGTTVEERRVETNTGR